MKQMDLGFGYEIGQRTSATALRANTSELILRYRFVQSNSNSITTNPKESTDSN